VVYPYPIIFNLAYRGNAFCVMFLNIGRIEEGILNPDTGTRVDGVGAKELAK
jgi:hypothetical protein